MFGPAVTFERMFHDHSGSTTEDQDGDEGGYQGLPGRRRRRTRATPRPSVEGKRLMESGTFGTHEKRRPTTRQKKPSVVSRLMERELGYQKENKTANQLISQVCLIDRQILDRC